MLQKRLGILGKARQVFVIEMAVTLQHMRNRISQRRVGTGPQGNVMMALFSGIGTVGINRPQHRAVTLGLLNLRPKMHVTGDRVGTPQHNELGAINGFGVHANALAHAHF